MSSKIDGVPRELLEDFLNHRDNGDWYDGVWITHLDRLRTLLAAPAADHCEDALHMVAPVVERQPVAHQFQDRQGAWLPFVNEHHYKSTVADGTWPIRALYDSPPELAELQATIERLRAELGECKGEYDRAVNKVDVLRDGLKSARNDLLAVAHLVPGDYIQKSVASAEAAGATTEQKCETCHDQGEVFVSKGKVEYGMLTEPDPIYAPCQDCTEPANKESAQ